MSSAQASSGGGAGKILLTPETMFEDGEGLQDP